MSECHYNGKDFEDNFHASIEKVLEMERALRWLLGHATEAFVETPALASEDRFEALRSARKALE